VYFGIQDQTECRKKSALFLTGILERRNHSGFWLQWNNRVVEKILENNRKLGLYSPEILKQQLKICGSEVQRPCLEPLSDILYVQPIYTVYGQGVFEMKLALVLRRRICLALALVFILSSLPIDVEARQRFSTIQGNVHEEAEIAPYAGGKKAGPIKDWEQLCKIEADPELQAKALKEAKEGNLDKVFVLACMYFHGKGVEKNQAAAFELYKYAANKGHSNSQNNLGFMYEEGLGTKKDLKQAMAWYQKAADYKNGAGTCNLANMIEHGRGVPANPEQAYSLYQKAAELGNKIAGQNVFAYDFEKERLSKIKGATPSKPGVKTAVVPKVPFTYSPTESAPPVVAEPVKAVQEEKVVDSADGLQAGTPTLTAILNRLSKGTSLEHLAAKPEVSQAVEPKVGAKSEPKVEPKVEAKAESKVEPKVEPKKEVAAKAKPEDKKAPVVAAKPSGTDELLN
jgi:FOG: TPR repeat, SEL1 subfamily